MIAATRKRKENIMVSLALFDKIKDYVTAYDLKSKLKFTVKR